MATASGAPAHWREWLARRAGIAADELTTSSSSAAFASSPRSGRDSATDDCTRCFGAKGGASTTTIADGRRLRTLNVVDAFTRECLAIEVDMSLPSARVVRVLARLVWQYGLPESLRVDNGPEFISSTLDRWAFQHGVELHFIQPGKLVQNARVESFNGHFRDECLAQAHFPASVAGDEMGCGLDFHCDHGEERVEVN